MKTIAFILTMLVPAVVSAQETPTGATRRSTGSKCTTKSTEAAIRWCCSMART